MRQDKMHNAQRNRIDKQIEYPTVRNCIKKGERWEAAGPYNPAMKTNLSTRTCQVSYEHQVRWYQYQ